MRPFGLTSWLAALIVAWALTASPLRAQPAAEAPPSEDAAAPDAGQLFDQGLADMLAGRFETGCPALAKSYELEPLAGALFTLAECEAKWGKLATAMRHYRDYVGMVQSLSAEDQQRQQERLDIARDQIDALRGEAPKLELIVPKDAPAGTIVTLDGEPLDEAELSSPVPVDPGQHRITIEVPGGQAPNSYDVEVVKNQRRALRLELPSTGTEPEPGPEGDGMSLRDWSYVVGGVGAAFLVVGIISGAVTLGEKGTIEDNCVGLACTPDGLDAADAAQTSGAVSTVGFVVGGAALAAAVVMFILGGDEDGPGDGGPDAEAEVEIAVRPAVIAPLDGANGLVLGIAGSF